MEVEAEVEAEEVGAKEVSANGQQGRDPAPAIEVDRSGEQVTIAYVGGSRGGSSGPAGGSLLTLCNTDWLCASAWHSRKPATRFERLRPLPAAVNGSGGEGNGTFEWFGLRSVANGKLVQMAPPYDAEGWVVRARTVESHGASAASLRLGALEQWRVDGRGIRNRATNALLNFRGGVSDGDGVSVRGHGDTKPRAAAVRPTRRTRFVLRSPSAAHPSGAAGRDGTCVALGVATRSRAEHTSVASLPLFNVLVPSVLATIQRNATARPTAPAADGGSIRFELHVGYDADDPYWSDAASRERARDEFGRLSAGYPLRLNLSQVEGSKGAPCWVWNRLLERACAAGCDYFYQLNDDIRLDTPGWADEFVSTLRDNPLLPNFGITGPMDTNNPKLMTQSFVHCRHLEIFGWYYPRRFTNWYSDDWATRVYGGRHTFWRKDIEVHHKLAHLGPRYEIAYADEQHLDAEVAAGRRTLAQYLRARNLSAESVTSSRRARRRSSAATASAIAG